MIPRAWAWLVVLAVVWQPPGTAAAAKTRIVSTKYGQVQGLIRHLGHLLGDVEVFLGVPYASPPIEEGRFTPTNTPTPWEGVLDATTQPPVCPQLLPEPDESYMPRARAQFIRQVKPALANQSEDCLTLNIYTPIMGEEESRRQSKAGMSCMDLHLINFSFYETPVLTRREDYTD